MEIILLKDMEKLGKAGQIVKVNDGFARNFLMPRGWAMISTAKNLKSIEQDNKLKELWAEKEKKLAQAQADKIKGISCTVAVEANENDKLYGSISQQDIASALEIEGHKIDKKNIILEKTIEELGIYDIEVRLHPEVSTKIKLWVTKR